LLSFGPNTTPSQREALADRLGTDKPFYEQYFTWLVGDDFREYEQLDSRGNPVLDEEGNPVIENGTRKGILRGDFGRSFTAKKPAMDVIREKVLATLELGVLSLLVGLGVGVPIGIMAAVNQGGFFDQVTRVLAVVFNAIPIFWLGLLLILVFGSWLGWLPMGNRYPVTYALTKEVTLWERIQHLMMPVFVLSAINIAVFSRFMRASTLDILHQDYIRTAKAKGLPNSSVWSTHAARNALIPIATLIGPSIPNILGGALITETIFSWPGLGRLAFSAVIQLDYPVVMGTVILAGVSTILGFLISDILYGIIDPRVRLS
jgi:peptide/nickel transport system permease protein